MDKTYKWAELILLMGCLLVGCGNGEPEDKMAMVDEIEERESDETVQNVPDESSPYVHVIAEYQDMVQNDFYMDLQGSDTYDSSFEEHIGSEIRCRRQDVYYALYDIDGNGTEELVIAGEERGESNTAFSPWNYDLYGYDGRNVVRIFPEMEFGYRTNFSLYENGMIEVFYTSSAAESGVDFYKIAADGIHVELVDSFKMVGHLEGEKPVFTYFQKEDEITEKDYTDRIQNYEIALTADIEWIKIQQEEG